MGSELREMTSLPSLSKFFVILFVQVEHFIIGGGSVRFGVSNLSHQQGKSDRSVRLERHDKLTDTVVQSCLEIGL